MLMTTSHDKFQIVRLDSNDVPKRDRLAYVRNIYGRTIIEHDIDPHPDSPFNWQSVLQTLPGLGLATTVCSGIHTQRTCAQAEGDDLILHATWAGKRIVRQFGREAIVQPGEVVVTRSQDVVSSDCDPNSRLVDIRVPLSALSPINVDLDFILVRTIPASTKPLPLLLRYIDLLQQSDTPEAPETRPLVAAHIHDLVMLLLGATCALTGGSAQAARLHAIKVDIVANIEQRDLSLSSVAARFDVSTRCVSILFKNDGTTFSEFVLEARLRRAHRLLYDPRKIRHTISDIAFECGFGDVSHFNKSFRRRYGATPSAVRKAVRRQGHD